MSATTNSDDSGLGKYVSRSVGSVDGGLETVSDVDLQQFSFGADYRLSKNTLVYGHYTKYDGDMMLAGASQDLSADIVTERMRFDF